MSRTPMTRLRSTRQGMTLVEILAGTLITSIVVGGTMTAFVTAARIQHVTASALAMRASDSVQELLERLRNRVAEDDAFFEDKALATGLPPGVWLNDDASTQVPPLPIGDPAEEVKRVYKVQGKDCDNDGLVASPGPPLGPAEVDCYSVTVKVCWDQPTCP